MAASDGHCVLTKLLEMFIIRERKREIILVHVWKYTRAIDIIDSNRLCVYNIYTETHSHAKLSIYCRVWLLRAVYLLQSLVAKSCLSTVESGC